ncbi:cohesin domain-containing protein, partial [Candidatus Poribacteria bacterium]
MRYSAIIFLFLTMGMSAYADQVIYIDVADFIPGDSQFGVAVKGNEWVEVDDPDALDGQAFGGPGDNNYSADGGNPFRVAEPYLIIEFPEDVKPGESTADGKVWVPWARMRVPADFNSFYWQVSADKVRWEPAIITNAVRWNDDGRNGSNEWYWQDNITGNDGGINADIETGVNYVRIGVRESDPVLFPLIDVVCFRNDGEQPSDDEAEQHLKTVRPREPEQQSGSGLGTWGMIKHSPVVYIEEQHVDVNTTFDVDVRISNAKNLAGFQISLDYDPYNLQLIAVREGKALSGNGQANFWRDPDIDTEAGTIIGAASVITETGGTDIEDDVLMTLTFQAKELGRTMLSLQDIRISGPNSKFLPLLAISTSITISPPWDVVPDSIVDVLDMVAVAQHLASPQLAALLTVQGDVGSAPDEEYNPDVDRNGAVDVDDLILVSNHFGEVYNDSGADQQLSLRTEARRAYDMINAAPYNSPAIRKFKAHLKQLLAMDRSTSLPMSSDLLPNYPSVQPCPYLCRIQTL